MRTSGRIACGLALLALGCSCSEASAPAPAPGPAAPATSAAPPSSTAPAPSAAPVGAAHTPPTDAQRHQVAALVRTARAAERTGDHAAAMTAFDAALAITPFDARVLCEAGFVAHRAQRDTLAAQRIDTALALFGAPSSVGEDQRAQLAMCLFNRGLVDEARGDPASAVVHCTESLALRPNDTVTARRTAASAMPAAAHVGDTMDGVPVELRDGGLFVETIERARLEAAMRTGLAGVNEFDYAYADAGATTIEVLGELASSDAGGRPTIAYRVSAPGMPIDTSDVVLALPADGGWFLALAAEGGDEERAGQSWSRAFRTATLSMAGAYVRLEIHGHASTGESGMDDPPEGVSADYCQLDAYHEYDFDGLAYCRPGARPRCFTVPEANVAAYDESWTLSCSTEDGTDVPLPNGGESTEHHPAQTTTVTLGDDGRFTVRQVPPPDGSGATSGPQTFEERCAQESVPSGLTDREHAEFRTEGDGWYEQTDD